MPFTKGTKRSAKREAESEEDEVVTKPTKKTKISKSADGDKDGVDKDGNPFWDLSNKRRVGISEFNKSTFVNIREYYEKEGTMLPGKKYEALLKAVPAINAKLREMGHEVKEDQQSGGSPAAEETSNPAAKEDKSKKANIEATSDEDSE